MLKRFPKVILLFLLPLIAVLAVLFWPKKEIEESLPREKKISSRGIYITSNVARAPKLFARIKEQAKKSGLNTIVVDAKYSLEEPVIKLVKERKLTSRTLVAPDPWLSKLAAELHEEGFIVTARLVVFKDDHLVIARPDLAVRVKGGKLYLDHKGGRWADPYAEEVRLYNQLIAEIAAISGADEVQFDYIRFPAEAGSHNAYYPFEVEGVSRVETINSFLKGARERLRKYNVSIAVDIFGVTAWQSRNDIENLGQDLKGMAKHIDVLSPMFYPSHFHAGYDGFKNPGEHPYYFIKTGVKKTKEILSGEAVAIVPWIQGFNLRSPNFGPNYILDQVRACREEAIAGYLIWNARNDYSS